MFIRLVASTAEPDNSNSCWIWIKATRRHRGGNRPAVTVRVPGKKNPVRKIAYRVMLEIFEDIDPDDEASHLCGNWMCINPDHVIGESNRDNIARRDGKVLPLPAYRPHLEIDPDWRAGVLCDPDLIPF